MADADDRWVVLTSDSNQVRLEMWRELLDAEGIPTQIPGLRHGQMYGGLGGVGVEVRVRASDAERARDLLESLDLGDLVDEEHHPGDSEPPPQTASGDGPYRRNPRHTVRPVQPKRMLVSTAIGVLMPFGAAHFYAGEIASGIVLALAQVFALGVFVSVQTGKGSAMFALGILIDIVFARGAVLRANADKRYSLIGQLARIVPLVLIALLIAHGLSLAFPPP